MGLVTSNSGKDLIFLIFAFLFSYYDEAYFPFVVAAARDMKNTSHVTARYLQYLAVTSPESLKSFSCFSENGK